MNASPRRNGTMEVQNRLVVETCCACHMQFAMPETLKERLLEKRVNGNGPTFFCPAGHAQHYTGEPTAEKLRREIERLRQQEARLHEERRQAEQEAKHERARANGFKGALARNKTRIAHGVCPCCTRSFANLQRHMATKHPEFAETKEEALCSS
jgi:hypothetical protein